MTNIVATATMWAMGTKNTKNTLGYDIGRSSWYLKTLFNKYLRAEGQPLTQEQWSVLKIVRESQAISQTELAHRSLRDKTNITRILDGLEKKGFVERRKDEHDRRMYRIHCTPEGEDVLSSVYPVWAKVEKIYEKGLSKDEVDQLRSLLGKFCTILREHL